MVLCVCRLGGCRCDKSQPGAHYFKIFTFFIEGFSNARLYVRPGVFIVKKWWCNLATTRHLPLMFNRVSSVMGTLILKN